MGSILLPHSDVVKGVSLGSLFFSKRCIYQSIIAEWIPMYDHVSQLAGHNR